MSNVPELKKFAQDLVRLALQISHSDFVLLMALGVECQGYGITTLRRTVPQLIEMSGLSQPTVTKTLKRLVDLGLLDVSPHAGPFPRTITMNFAALEALGNPVPVVRKRTRRAA